MYVVRSTKSYRKEHKKVSQHKNFEQKELDAVINVLATGEKLDAKYRDHQLVGKFDEYRECHIKDDILLMYQKYDNVLVLLLVDLGSYYALFR